MTPKQLEQPLLYSFPSVRLSREQVCSLEAPKTKLKLFIVAFNFENDPFKGGKMTAKLTKMMMALACVASSAIAQADDIRLGEPGYGGSGCPSNSASVTLAPDQKSLSILFDQYVVEAGAATRKRLDRKSCNIAIPVHVPQGYSIAVFQVDYRGFTALPYGARGTFNVENFFAGSQGPRRTKTFYGPSNQDYLLTDDLSAESLVWTPCGADTNLRINTSMTVQTNGSYESAMATVDSADVSAGLIYHIQWRRCY